MIIDWTNVYAPAEWVVERNAFQSFLTQDEGIRQFLASKGTIIIPGLLFDASIWWLYIFALISSLGLIWSSTVKTIPTLIWFNILWSGLAIVYVAKHFGLIL